MVCVNHATYYAKFHRPSVCDYSRRNYYLEFTQKVSSHVRLLIQTF